MLRGARSHHLPLCPWRRLVLLLPSSFRPGVPSPLAGAPDGLPSPNPLPLHVFSGQPGRLEGAGETGLEAQEMRFNTYLGLNQLHPKQPPGPGPISQPG